MKHFLKSLFSVVCVAPFLFVSSWSAHATGERMITLSGPAIWDSSVLLEMVETQPLQSDGLVFRFEKWNNPNQLRAALLKGDVDMAITPSITAALFSNKNVPLRVLAAHELAGNLTVVGRGKTVSSIADLKNETIAVPFKGGLPDILMQRLGAYADQVMYTATPVEAMQLLIGGKVQNAFLAEPFATIALASADDLSARLDVCDAWKRGSRSANCPVVGIAAYGVSALSDSEIDRVKSAYRRAFQTIAANPERAASLLAANFPALKKAILQQAFAKLRPEILDGEDAANALRGFYKEVLSVAPLAIGGQLPADDFLVQDQ